VHISVDGQTDRGCLHPDRGLHVWDLGQTNLDIQGLSLSSSWEALPCRCETVDAFILAATIWLCGRQRCRCEEHVTLPLAYLRASSLVQLILAPNHV
jgi:hypothetical protein